MCAGDSFCRCHIDDEPVKPARPAFSRDERAARTRIVDDIVLVADDIGLTDEQLGKLFKIIMLGA